jgi:hypothetical protein
VCVCVACMFVCMCPCVYACISARVCVCMRVSMHYIYKTEIVWVLLFSTICDHDNHKIFHIPIIKDNAYRINKVTSHVFHSPIIIFNPLIMCYYISAYVCSLYWLYTVYMSCKHHLTAMPTLVSSSLSMAI